MIPILSLALISFLQSTILGGEWVLIFLISRSFIVGDRKNYWLAFFFGLFLALLSSSRLGFLSLFYLLVVFLVQLFKKVSPSSHWLTVLPLTLSLLLGEQLLEMFFGGGSLNIWLILQSLASLPVYFLVLFWEDRLAAKPDIRLKIGK